MNILKRSIASELSLFSHHPSRKWRFLLYSTTYTLNPPKPPKRSPTPTPPKRGQILTPSSSLSKIEAVKLADWPRPSEIPYQAKVANLVNLIGHIRAPVKFWTSPDGKYWACTVIYRENIQGNSCLIPVVFEGDLARVVTFHVKENDCVYVIGRLSEDPLPLVLSETPGKLHLRVENINFVQGFEKLRGRKKLGGNLSSESDGIVILSKEECKGDRMSEKGGVRESIVAPGGENYRTSTKSVGSKKGEDSGLNSWRGDPVQNSKEWRYYGEQKSTECKGDLLSEKGGVRESIVAPGGENYRTSTKSVGTKKGEGSGLDSWRDLVQNSKEWRDYREQKSKGLVSNKYPDFKHKDTGTALWLGRSAPEWVLGGLESLEFDTPTKQKQVKDAKEDLWRSLAENPNDWWDNRLKKKNPKSPDFKHKTSGEVLWLNNLPDWVLSKLPPLGETKC